MQRWSAADAGDGQVDVARYRINGDGVRFMANRIVAQLFKLPVGLIKDRSATAAAYKDDVCKNGALKMQHLHNIDRTIQPCSIRISPFRLGLPATNVPTHQML